MTLILRDCLNRMIANAEALQRLQKATGDAPLDADRVAHLHELFGEISVRVTRVTDEIHNAFLLHHKEQRLTPHQRRSGLGDRRQRGE